MRGSYEQYQFDRIEQYLQNLEHSVRRIEHVLHRGTEIMSDMDDRLAQLTTDTAALSGVVDSAVKALNGVQQMVADAVAQALAAGATPAELQAISDVDTALKAKSAALAAAIPAGTPAATP